MKQAEEKLSVIAEEYEDKLIFAQAKIKELMDLIEHLEQGQCIYIAHKNDKIDFLLANFINKYPERRKMNIMFLRESEGVYQFG